MQPAPPLPSLCARARSYACKTKFSMKEVADTDGSGTEKLKEEKEK